MLKRMDGKVVVLQHSTQLYGQMLLASQYTLLKVLVLSFQLWTSQRTKLIIRLFYSLQSPLLLAYTLVSHSTLCLLLDLGELKTHSLQLLSLNRVGLPTPLRFFSVSTLSSHTHWSSTQQIL